MRYYTNVEIWAGKVFYRGIDDGRRVSHKVDYNPTLFVPSKTPTKYKTIHGDYVGPVKPGSIRDARDFVKQYDGVESFKIYGNTRYQYCFIADEFPHVIDWNINDINVANLDIEVGSENGFPEPETANQPLTAITVKMNGRFVTFGVGQYDNSREDVSYFECYNEHDLIIRFLSWWESDYPDIITGWNVEQFDIPYLVNRITKLEGEKVARRLSPWNVLQDKVIDIGLGRRSKGWNIFGIATLDMMALYKKYAPGGQSQESYRLDNIAHVELGERKLSYDEYGSLHNLYKIGRAHV